MARIVWLSCDGEHTALLRRCDGCAGFVPQLITTSGHYRGESFKNRPAHLEHLHIAPSGLKISKPGAGACIARTRLKGCPESEARCAAAVRAARGPSLALTVAEAVSRIRQAGGKQLPRVGAIVESRPSKHVGMAAAARAVLGRRTGQGAARPAFRGLTAS